MKCVNTGFPFFHSRELAESSPYYEAMVARDVEVLFASEGLDELVLINLQEYDKKKLKSIENELHDGASSTSTDTDSTAGCEWYFFKLSFFTQIGYVNNIPTM